MGTTSQGSPWGDYLAARAWLEYEQKRSHEKLMLVVLVLAEQGAPHELVEEIVALERRAAAVTRLLLALADPKVAELSEPSELSKPSDDDGDGEGESMSLWGGRTPN